MAIVSVSIVSDQTSSGGQRRVVFEATDHLGAKHRYGPTYCNATFDAEAHKAIVSVKVAASLAEAEYEQVAP